MSLPAPWTVLHAVSETAASAAKQNMIFLNMAVPSICRIGVIRSTLTRWSKPHANVEHTETFCTGAQLLAPSAPSSLAACSIVLRRNSSDAMEAAACSVAIASVRIPPPKSDGRGLSGHLHSTSPIFSEPAERQPLSSEDGFSGGDRAFCSPHGALVDHRHAFALKLCHAARDATPRTAFV